MRTLAVVILTMTLSGCATGAVNEAAICDGTAATRTAHAAALVVDAGAQSRATGRALIARLDAACGD